LEQLTALAPDKLTRGQYWPADATRLSRKINELKFDLTALGVGVKSVKSNGVILLTIERSAPAATAADVSPPPPTLDLSPGDVVVMDSENFKGTGLPKNTRLTVRQVKFGTNPQPGHDGWWAQCDDSDGKTHPVWVQSLRLPTEADRLGTWEVAA
jgi:hypothetical protein